MNMQYLRRLLFAVCVCLSVLFSSSHIAYAVDDEMGVNLDSEDYNSSNIGFTYSWLVNNNSHIMCNRFFVNGFSYTDNSYNQSLSAWNTNTSLRDSLYFTLADSNRMFSKGSSIDLELMGIQNYNMIGTTMLAISNTSSFNVSLVVKNASGVLYDIELEEYNIKNNNLNYSYGLTLTSKELPCDVYGFYIYIDYSPLAYRNISNYLGTSNTMTHKGGIAGGYLNVNEVVKDKTDGLLSSIIQIVTNIKDGIINLPSKIANSIKGFFDNVVNTLDNVKTAITTALDTLGNMLLDGIKNLFIPSQDDITDMQEDWEHLLADRFGAIYQAVALIFDYVDAFQDREQGSIEFPVVSIPLGNDTSFEFGGYIVKVVPDKFGVLIDALKMVVSISCTVLFVNTLKRKYDKLVEG